MASRRVLFVDDEMVIRMLVQRIFATSADDATVVRGVTEAVAKLGSEAFDLVITDVNMPKGGGAAVAKEAFSRDVPVLFVTGVTSGAADLQSFLSQGARLLRKPFTPQELLDLADEMITEQAEPARAEPDS